MDLPFKTNFKIAGLIKDSVAGSLCALVMLAYASSFATLIFGSQLSSSISLGIWTALIGSFTAMLVLSFMSSFRFSLGGPDSNPSAIIAISVASIAHDFLSNPTEPAGGLLPTICIYLFGSALLCGAFLYIFGQLRWGRYIRYIPHPVIGGFLAGTGYLLLAGGWKMLVGKSLYQTQVDDILRVPLIGWFTAIGVAIALTIATRRSKHFLVIPVVLTLGVLIFHLVLACKSISISEARASGLLLPPLMHGDWNTLFNQPFNQIRWDLILSHGKDFASMFLVVLITVLLNATSLEIATGQDANYDQELKALGAANILSGFAGGLVSVNSFNRSMLNYHAGASSPWAARICASLVLGIPLFFPNFLSLMPKPVLTGLVIFLGISLLLNWLWDSKRNLPVADYLTIVAILGVVAVLGITFGVIFGVGLAIVTFVISFSRQSVVKNRFNSLNRRSNVERHTKEIEFLNENGSKLQGFILHGDLFFGTACSLLDEIQEVLGKAQTLLMDFWHVRSIDASSVIILKKILRLAKENNTEVAITGLQESLRKQIEGFGLKLDTITQLLFKDLDHGLEWAESRLLNSESSHSKINDDLNDIPFILGIDQKLHIDNIANYFEMFEIEKGELLFKRGDHSDSLFLILKGQVSIYLKVQSFDYSKRLRSYGFGTIVGEMGFYNQLPRSADVVADALTRVGKLSRKSFEKLESENAALAGEFHRFVINTLSARLRATNEEIRNSL